MKLDEKKTEELMTSLSPRYITEFASPVPAEKKSAGFAWKSAAGLAACFVLVAALVVGNVVLAGNNKGNRYTDGTVYKVKPIESVLSEEIGGSLYVYTVTGGKHFDEIVSFIKEGQNSKNEELRNLLEGVDLSYALPTLRFTQAQSDDFTYSFPVVENGRIVKVVYGFIGPSGKPAYVVQTNPALQGIKGGMMTTCEILERLASLTSQDKPLMTVGLDTTTETAGTGIITGFNVVGDTAYYDNTDEALIPAFETMTPGIDWDRVEENGWKLTVKELKLR